MNIYFIDYTSLIELDDKTTKEDIEKFIIL